MYEQALKSCERSISSSKGAILTESKLQKTILFALNYSINDFISTADSLWTNMIMRNQNDIFTTIDLSIGIIYLISKRYCSNRDFIDELNNLKYLEQTLITRLTENKLVGKAINSDFTNLLIWTVTYASMDYDSFDMVLYWFLYINGDLESLAGSIDNIQIFMKMSNQMHHEHKPGKSLMGDILYNVIQGTICKYLGFYRVAKIDHLNGEPAPLSKSFYISALSFDRLNDVSCLEISKRIYFELSELECLCFNNWTNGFDYIKQALQDRSDGERLLSMSLTSSINPAKPSFAKRKDAAKTEQSYIETGNLRFNSDWEKDFVFDKEFQDRILDQKCKNSHYYIQEKLEKRSK
jgi:hypothetical protein